MLFHKLEKRSYALGNGANQMGFAMQNGQLVPVSSGVSAAEGLRDSDIMSGVNLIASDVASANFKTNVDDPDLINLLEHPSNIFSAYNFWLTVITNLLLQGNTFVVIHRNPATGKPTYLEILLNAEIMVYLTDDWQHIFYQINFWDNRPVKYVQSTEMLHFRLLPHDVDTNLIVLGQSPLNSLYEELSIKKQSNKLTMTQLAKSINPSGILTINRGLPGKKEKENTRNEFMDANMGTNAGKPLVLDSITTYKPTALDPNVLEMLKGTDWVRSQVAKILGIPLDLLQTNSSEHSNLQQIMTVYAACLNRYINPLCSELTTKLCTLLPSEKVSMDSSSVTDPDNSNIETRMGNLVKNQVLSSDEAKAILAKKGGW